jgi:hypothetical protein
MLTGKSRSAPYVQSPTAAPSDPFRRSAPPEAWSPRGGPAAGHQAPTRACRPRDHLRYLRGIDNTEIIHAVQRAASPDDSRQPNPPRLSPESSLSHPTAVPGTGNARLRHRRPCSLGWRQRTTGRDQWALVDRDDPRVGNAHRRCGAASRSGAVWTRKWVAGLVSSRWR